MSTPHDDAPPAHEPDCLPPEPCVCAGLRGTDGNPIKDALARLTQEWLDKHVRHEIQALVKRGNITLEERAALRCNSWEWEHVYPALTDEALLAAVEHNLTNCARAPRPCTTYDEALSNILAPLVVERWKRTIRRDADQPTADTVTTADLDLVDRLDREATPGPWVVRYEREGRGVSQPDHEGSDRFILEEGANGTREDVEFAVRARTLLPRLARELRHARDALGILNETVERQDAEAARLNIDRARAIPEHKAAIEDAYASGRREAIEEAARYLRDATAMQIRAHALEHESPIAACASAIEAHEAERARVSK